MKMAIATLCVAACFSTPMFAQETEKKPDLVTTAKQSKEKRKKSATRVLTNKDVKHSKGKLIILSGSAEKQTAPAPATPVKDPDTLFRERKDATAHVETAQKKVDALQKEVDDLEQQYYRENDPNYRDNVIQQRFNQVKRQLDDARHELADARDAVKKLEPSSK